MEGVQLKRARPEGQKLQDDAGHSTRTNVAAAFRVPMTTAALRNEAPGTMGHPIPFLSSALDGAREPTNELRGCVPGVPSEIIEREKKKALPFLTPARRPLVPSSPRPLIFWAGLSLHI